MQLNTSLPNVPRLRKNTGEQEKNIDDSNSGTSLEQTSGPDSEIDLEEPKKTTQRTLSEIDIPNAFLTAVSMFTMQDNSNHALRLDPQSFTEAMRSLDAKEWRTAITAEWNSLLENSTFEVVDLPPGRKALSSKWVLKKKLNKDNEVAKYKARVVARGFQQVEGYDYTETYLGVVKAAAYRILFALTVLAGWTCH